MSKTLIIISDLWGFAQADWIKVYLDRLQPHYIIRLYDTQKLAQLPTYLTTEEALHNRFTKGGGLTKAVFQLLRSEKKYSDDSVSVLGFSIGGTIAWQAALQGLNTTELWLVSATRLRYEMQKPNGTLNLFYGADDVYKPQEVWFKKLDLAPPVLFNKNGHEFYRNTLHAQLICSSILDFKTKH